MENASNNLDPSLVTYVMHKYYSGYLPQYSDDLYSYGLQALYEADSVYTTTKTNKPFKYFATCLIRRAMFTYVRDKISAAQQNTTYTDDTQFLEHFAATEPIRDDYLDLYNVLKKLSDEEKAIIYNIYYLDKTIKETSNILKLKYATTDRKLKKLLEKLKEKLSMNHKDALYLAIKYIQDTNDLTLYEISNIIQVSKERLKEFLSKYE